MFVMKKTSLVSSMIEATAYKNVFLTWICLNYMTNVIAVFKKVGKFKI